MNCAGDNDLPSIPWQMAGKVSRFSAVAMNACDPGAQHDGYAAKVEDPDGNRGWAKERLWKFGHEHALAGEV
jgi:hypothetical protein